MATGLLLIALGIAITLRAGKLAGAATELQTGSEPSPSPASDNAPARGRLPLPGLPSIPLPDVVDPSRKG